MKKLFLLLCACFLLCMLCLSAGAAKANLVYLRDGGDGNGSSPEKAVATLAEAYNALDLDGDCTVVVCGAFTQSEPFAYGKEYAGKVTFTSVYGGVDYRTQGAVYNIAPTSFACYGETCFENLDFVASGSGYTVVGRHHPVTVGLGVTVTGEKMTTGTLAKSFCIFGGYYKGIGEYEALDDADTSITVLSGSKFYLIPFSRNIDGTYLGTARMHIGGTANVPVVHGSCVGSDVTDVGNVEVTVSDSAKIRSFYGATSPVSVESYTFTWTGGTIGEVQWNCKATPAADIAIAGKTVLHAPLSMQQRDDFVKNAIVFDSVKTIAEADLPKEDTDMLKNATVVYIKDGGTGRGTSEKDALPTLEAAYAALDLSKDCTVVVCGTFTQKEDFDFGIDYTGSVTLTSVYGGNDYRKAGAVYQAEDKKFVCYGDSRFENMDFLALGSSMHVVGQHNPITVGEGVTVTGEKMTTGTLAKSFCLYGGYYKGIGAPKSMDDRDTSITVLSGQKFYIVAYSRSMVGEYTGTAHITVGGSANVPVVHCSCTGANGNQLGNVDLTVTDNAVIRSIYGATSPVKLQSATLTWTGGSFRELQWNCGATPAADISFGGDRVLRASDEVKARDTFGGVAALFDTVVGADETVETTPAVEAPSIRSDYGCARGLYLLGLAQGYNTTGTNFGLKDKMTRAQTVVQVIRFLGVESEVKAGNFAHPFTDVPAWASNYVGYAYQNKITSGVSATKFDPDGETTEAQFLTFMLRAIGYSDAKGDFVWSDPWKQARNVGMTPTAQAGIVFTRGDAFRFAWNTLYSKAKSGVTVKDDLMAKGVFTADVLEKAVAEAKVSFEPTAHKVATDAGDFYVLPVDTYRDKTTAGFLGELVGFFSGFEFVYWSDGRLRVAMPDDWFEICNGPYANPNPHKTHSDKLLLNAETGIWEAWMDDDYSIDILDQYILRDMYAQYGTFTSKVITDDWVKYNVYDMGGGHRSVGAYGLMSKYRYLPEFAGAWEFGNRYSYCYEPCIGNETVGMSTAGMPDTSVRFSEVFATVTGDQDNVVWTKFLSAMYSLAYLESDIPTLIRTAQKIIPADSFVYKIIDECFAIHKEFPDDWRAAQYAAEERFLLFKDRMISDKQVDCHVNNAFVLLALLYGEGDYHETCKIVSLAGYDADSSGAITMGLMGVIGGMDTLPAEAETYLWQDGRGIVVNNHLTEKEGYWMCMLGLPERMPIPEIIDLYQQNFENILLENGGKIENGNYYIPKQKLGSADSVYFENFDDGDVSDFTVKGGTLTLVGEGFEGKYTAKLSASENGESSMYTKLSGLTVGETYRVTAYISTTAETTAELFVREAGKTGVHATVYNTEKHIRRSLTFTATAKEKELGIRIPHAGNAFRTVTVDHISVYRIAETTAAKASLAAGTYTGEVHIPVLGKAEREVLLKVTFANPASTAVRTAVRVNGEDFGTAPFYPTGTVKAAADATYIPVLLQGEQTTVTLDFDKASVYIDSVEVVTLRELW